MQHEGPEKRFLHPLEKPYSRAGRFATSFAVQGVGLALLLHFGVIAPKSLAPQSVPYQTVELVSPFPNPLSRPPAPPMIAPRTIPRTLLPTPALEAPPVVARQEIPQPRLPEVTSAPPQTAPPPQPKKK